MKIRRRMLERGRIARKKGGAEGGGGVHRRNHHTIGSGVPVKEVEVIPEDGNWRWEVGDGLGLKVGVMTCLIEMDGIRCYDYKRRKLGRYKEGARLIRLVLTLEGSQSEAMKNFIIGSNI